ncbi:MAG: 30S ribosomal protein S1 [Candidatus Reconcilbacillus cellulovorans]|uniref:30S ribosomal protein S1 n=1 Tax=Candidatus Reconcilbacillus cellulovorans TaxID=1906605 RepID=A0A2A6E0H4_9BACL|nr:MAG: 30S ribosomal protein S1 [Candidatus Reconcilbacillus cellulovorans]
MTEEAKLNDGAVEEHANQAEEAAQDLSRVETIRRGDIVRGKVVKLEDQQAVVSIGYKYDGVVPLRELSNIPVVAASEAVQVGDEVELKVLAIDDEQEKLILSKRAVDSQKAWERLQRALETGEIIEAPVRDVVKGGLVVDVGVRGFVPASLVERHFVEDFSGYKGRVLRLKVKELDRGKNRVVLSQKDVLDEEYEANKKRILQSLQPGQRLEGTVRRITPFGAFVDIGGIDGLVHISEMAWHRVETPAEVVQEGDRVTVQVLRVDPENERVSLSIKAAQPGPWDQVAGKFSVGDIITGKVKRLVSFGAFVEVWPGVEGLVHISQIAHRHIGTPHEVLKEGQEVQVKVLDINLPEKRIALSIKETEEPPAPRERRNRREETYENPGFSLTLGERIGDQLSKLK